MSNPVDGSCNVHGLLILVIAIFIKVSKKLMVTDNATVLLYLLYSTDE
jgi:hypothetical protein